MRDTSGLSASAQQAVNNINNENTPFQRDRALKRKVLGAAITGGIGLVGGLMSGKESYDKGLANKQRARDEAVQSAIRNAKRPPSHPDDTPRDEYGLEVARPSYAGAMDASVERGTNQPLHSQPFSPKSTQDLARDISASNDANDAALAAPIGGKWTPQGFQDADMQASVNASDIQRAQAMMGQESLKDRVFGGLRNSFAGGN